MRKEEFLQTLRRALTGTVPPAVVEENMRYYQEYIDGEVRGGRSEEEVIAEIGDPRLIAKNIEDTTVGAGDGGYTDAGYTDQGYDNPYGQPDDPYREKRPFHLFDLSQWYGRAMVFLVIILVFCVVIQIVGGIFRLLAPLIGPLFIIWLIVTIVNGIRRR